MNSIAFWNCRGAKKKEASLYLKEFVRDHGILFVGLVEPKICNFNKVDLERILGKDWDLYMVPSDGLSGDEERGGRKLLFSQGPIEMVDFKNENDLHDVKDLHFWGKAKAKEFTSEKDKLKEEIFDLQDEEANGGWLCGEKLLKLRTKVRDLNVALSWLNTWWKQRAKVRWYEEGDANTKFFHSYASSRRSGNRITQVKNGSRKLTEDPKEIQEVFYRYFLEKWKQRNCLEDNWPAPYNSLDDDDRRRLSAEVSDPKITEMIKSLGNNRAPGVDGISYSFFKAYWNIVISDVCNAVKYFFAIGRMCKDWKLSKAADGMVAIKLDMEQAYDSMSWKMLHRMMVILGFPKQFMDLVMECIMEPRYAISINGGLSNWIEGKNGLHQGKDLSIKIAPNSPRISHLLYVDDVLLFSDAKIKSIKKSLIARYGKDWWRCESSRCGSSSWKIISSGWKALKGFVRWKAVNGRSIKVLKDIWILDKCLNRWSTYVVVFEDENSTLDYFIQDGRWNIEKLSLFFGKELLKLICNIQIFQDSESDYMELTRKLSGKSISSMLREESVREAAVEDQNAWIHKRRKLSRCNLCPKGCGEVEDVDHISTCCSKLMEVILELRKWGFPVPIFSTFQQCLNELKSVYEDNKLLVKLYFVMLWFSWNNRNLKVHGKKEDSISVAAAKIINFVNLDKVNKEISDYWDAGRSLGLCYDFWRPPTPEWYKINVDAALKKNYEASIGGIVQD
ncbi:hypothetical protein KFK09_009488 [Dendrobium nobile]|uniref:Reverse transcriptase domain-containing protein n=1 Tax=Dendrobium nobile TaxID=94219 RepID=A0A8T3BMY0_DENNO|nr:hypothetical protein KFK09_009488 [Dendrobium nobile]